jgi:pimeloyl-ACP methyl ester carboxylesterase
VYADTAISIPAGGTTLDADLVVPDDPRGVVVFAHGSGSSRHSPRNRMVAGLLQDHRLGTVLADLLTPAEAAQDAETGLLRFDIGLLAGRMTALVDWAVVASPPLRGQPIGLFGASTGAAAALVAASERPDAVRAVVSRGGRPDLAGDALRRVRAPTLLIVGARDRPVVVLNEQAATVLAGPHRLDIIPGATHLFEEPGALAEVADRAADWFTTHLAG